MSQSYHSHPKSYSEWADFWRYVIGVNVIPADTRNKRTGICWKSYQNAPVPEWLHEQWKTEGSFKKGMAIILGKVWHRKDKEDLYFILLDADKKIAIQELCATIGKDISIQKMAEKFVVEQHKDNLERAHFYFYSPIPFPLKSADSVLGLEVKGLGEHGIAMCSPSIHKDGAQYQILGTTEPVVLNVVQATEFIQNINLICIKYGLQSAKKNTRISMLRPMIRTLKVDQTVRIPAGQRHTTLISLANSLFNK